MSQFNPSADLPLKYINDLYLSNDAISPNTIIDCGPGQARDSNNQVDIVVGNYYGDGGGTVNQTTYINSAILGPGGLDSGVVADSTMYTLYAISDSSGVNIPAMIMSTSTSNPLMPKGFDSFRKIGNWATDGSANFYKGYYSNVNGNSTRLFYYDAPQSVLSGGTSSTLANVSLAPFVPARNNIGVWLSYSYVPGTAGNTFKLQPGNGTGTPITITGQVATVAMTGQVFILAQNVSSKPVINYQVISGDSVSISVLAYEVGFSTD